MAARREIRSAILRRASTLALIAALGWAIVWGAGAAGAVDRKPKLGEAQGGFRPVSAAAVLDVQLPDTLAPGERAYLGLGPGPFAVSGVRGDLVVVEFFNSSCYACALMAPVMEEVWHKVGAREDLKDRVRFLGIGVGNTPNQVREFRERYDTPFPMVADPEFTAFDALGTVEGTPYLLLVRRGPGGATAMRAQVGYIPDSERVVAEIAAALADEPLADATPRDLAGESWRALRPPLTAAELQERVKKAAAGAGLATATATEIRLPGGEFFYRVTSGERVLWAVVAGRARVCNVCHDIFFIVLFDSGGRVVDLAPITLTKYKNVEFDEKDVAFLKSRVVGRLLARDIVFDPTVDAVTAATMTSTLVFDTLRRLGDAWDGMVKAGLAQP